MKSLFTSAVALALLTLGTSGLVYAEDNSQVCSDRLIKGVYGFTLQGTKLGGPGPVGPQVGVARLNLTVTATFRKSTR